MIKYQLILTVPTVAISILFVYLRRNADNNLPVITQQPAHAVVPSGTAHTLRVVATSATTLSYQWRKNGADIAGATQPTYVIASFALADEGYYDVTVTNATGSVTSEPAWIGQRFTTISPAPSQRM